MFPPYSEKTAAQFPTRKTVPLLDNVQYCLYEKASAKLVKDWLDGKIGVGAPTENWEKQMIALVNEQNLSQRLEALDLAASDSGPETETVEQEKKIAEIYNELVKRNVPTHLRTATSHRKWIRMSLEFCKMSGVKFSGEMEELIRRHDLSKYTAEEVLGYAVMFGDGQVNWKPLEIPEEKTEWGLSLEHHYIHNPHHPEYFYVKQADGKREKFGIIEAENKGKLYMEESLIDMMASRGERNLKDDPTISVGKWLDIDEKYLTRYAEGDKKFVMELLNKWTQAAKDFVAEKVNADRLITLFGRAVEL